VEAPDSSLLILEGKGERLIDWVVVEEALMIGDREIQSTG
jgi:hypothetical protein